MKIHRSIFAIAIAVIMLCIAFNPPIASAEVYPARSTKVLVLCDESYRAYLKSSYGEYNSDIVVQLMKLAARPFSNVWNDGLDVTVASYENIIGSPNSVISSSGCCNNLWHWDTDDYGNRYREWSHFETCHCTSNELCIGGTSGYHHTSSFPILDAIQQYNIDCSTYDVVATIVGHQLCYTVRENNAYRHKFCGGMTYPWSSVFCVSSILDYTAWGNSSAYCDKSFISTIRTFQHELSHVFGCPDASCSANEACIMTGAFDGVISVNNLWCSSCQVHFSNNLGIFDDAN